MELEDTSGPELSVRRPWCLSSPPSRSGLLNPFQPLDWLPICSLSVLARKLSKSSSPHSPQIRSPHSTQPCSPHCLDNSWLAAVTRSGWLGYYAHALDPAAGCTQTLWGSLSLKRTSGWRKVNLVRPMMSSGYSSWYRA